MITKTDMDIQGLTFLTNIEEANNLIDPSVKYLVSRELSLKEERG